jgi:hypothetical protein
MLVQWIPRREVREKKDKYPGYALIAHMALRILQHDRMQCGECIPGIFAGPGSESRSGHSIIYYPIVTRDFS